MVTLPMWEGNNLVQRLTLCAIKFTLRRNMFPSHPEIRFSRFQRLIANHLHDDLPVPPSIVEVDKHHLLPSSQDKFPFD